MEVERSQGLVTLQIICEMSRTGSLSRNGLCAVFLHKSGSASKISTSAYLQELNRSTWGRRALCSSARDELLLTCIVSSLFLVPMVWNGLPISIMTDAQTQSLLRCISLQPQDCSLQQESGQERNRGVANLT